MSSQLLYFRHRRFDINDTKEPIRLSGMDCPTSILISSRLPPTFAKWSPLSTSTPTIGCAATFTSGSPSRIQSFLDSYFFVYLTHFLICYRFQNDEGWHWISGKTKVLHSSQASLVFTFCVGQVSQVSSLVFLAIWHGFAPGYFLCFFAEFLDLTAHLKLAAIMRPFTTFIYNGEIK